MAAHLDEQVAASVTGWLTFLRSLTARSRGSPQLMIKCAQKAG
jgi:hypothetical protein